MKRNPVPAPRGFRLPRRLRIPFEGKAFLLITLAVGAAAVNTGNNLLYLAFCMNLALIVVSGILSEEALRGVSLSARAASDAFPGRESYLAVLCSAESKRFPSMSLTARMRFGGETVAVRFPDIPPRGSATRVVAFRPARRGPVGAIPATLSTLFPFSLFEKSMDVRIPADLLVYPRPLPPGSAGGVLREAGPLEAPWSAGRPGASLKGVREHLPADPIRDIHWKATARMEKWMVKVREPEAAPRAEIRVPVHRSPEEFEELLSRACGSVIELDRRGIPFRLWIGERSLPSEDGRGAALATLAVARSDGGEIAPGEEAP